MTVEKQEEKAEYKTTEGREMMVKHRDDSGKDKGGGVQKTEERDESRGKDEEGKTT